MTYTYHITMDNGESLDVRADSAGEAIYLACHRMRGWCVKACFLGGDPDPETPELYRVPGKIHFEIPKHEPMPAEIPPGKQRLCCKYVRVGDIIHDGALSWKVIEIEELPVKNSFYCECVGAFQGNNSVAFRREQLLKVTRPEHDHALPA